MKLAMARLGELIVEWVEPSTNKVESGVISVHLSTPTGVVVLD